MSTILFNEIIYGPIKSRRLGSSLGVNLLPPNGKWCNFDCLYCECGFNKEGKDNRQIPAREDVRKSLERVLSDLSTKGDRIDSIT
jgi:wyosine [tRNA(Phe)-imidazoG37] synthetase (radical SAM superfamily)